MRDIGFRPAEAEAGWIWRGRERAGGRARRDRIAAFARARGAESVADEPAARQIPLVRPDREDPRARAGAGGEGPLRLNGRVVDRAHAPVRVGDVLSFAQRGAVRVLRVEALPARRGPPAEARPLYCRIDERSRRGLRDAGSGESEP